MKNSRARDVALVLAVTLAALGTRPTWAGGPNVYDTNGVAVGWSTAAPVPFSTDPGGLGMLSHAQADSLVRALFTVWEAIPTATITYQKAADLPVDVDDTNFGSYLGPSGGNTAPIGQNAIVFDTDGSIFDMLYGVGTGVIGFASPTWASDGAHTFALGSPVPPGCHVIEGMAFLNGQFIDGIDSYPPNGEMSLDRFKAVFVHEFGHFSGLGHTQIHGIAGAPGTNIAQTQPRETMFPFLDSSPTQLTPEKDDIVAISSLYPTPDFAANTFTISGRVLASDGTPISGIDVVARNIANDADAVSYVSGATRVPAGAYVLKGLTPGQSYRVDVREIDVEFQGGSRVGPFSPPVVMPGPPESYNGAAESADLSIDHPGDFVALTAAGGTTLSGVDILLNRQLFSVDNTSLGAGSFNGFAIADFDQDGTADFVSTQQGAGPGDITSFHKGLGGGAFAPAVTIDAFPGNAFVGAGQFNSSVDAHPDLVVSSGGQIRVYFGNGMGGFSAPTTVFSTSCGGDECFTGARVADLNGDGRDDLVAVVHEDDGSTTVMAWLATGLGTFAAVPTAFPASQNVDIADIAVGNFAGSPSLDVIGLNPLTPELELLVGNGLGGFTLIRRSLAAWVYQPQRQLVAGDFDEDGHLDVAYPDLAPIINGVNVTGITNSWLDILRGDGAGNFTLMTRVVIPENGRGAIGAADFDRDSHLDIVTTAFGPNDPGSKVVVSFGDGAGGIRRIESVWGLSEFTRTVSTGDLNGDAYPDLLVGHTDDHQASLLLNRLATLTAVTEPGAGVPSFQSVRNSPDPFALSTTLHYVLSSGGDVDVAVFDVRGRRIRSLTHRLEFAGPHDVAWDGTDDRGRRAPPGVYFYRVGFPGSVVTRRMVKLG